MEPARRQLERKLVDQRRSCRPLVDYVMSRPIVSAGMVAKELQVTPRAAQDLVSELGLREATGKRRYRAWGGNLTGTGRPPDLQKAGPQGAILQFELPISSGANLAGF